MLGNFLQTLFNIVDAYFLGKLGKEALSAPSISFTIVMFLIVFGFGLSLAGTTLISQAKGKGDQGKVDFYLGQTTTVLLIGSVLISAAGVIFAPQLLAMMQVPEAAFAYTLRYLRIVLAGLPFMFMAFVLQSCLQGIGDSMTPLILQAATVALNIGLDPLLIFGIGPFPRMEVTGAAVGTVVSRGIGSAAALVIFVRGRRGMKLTLANMVPRREPLKLLLKIGIPTSLGQGISALGFTVLQGVVNSLGTAVIAAFGVGNRIIGLFNMPAMGISRAAGVLVGQNLGAKDREGALRAARLSIVSILVFIVPSMTFTFFYGSHLVRFFIADPEVISYGVAMFRLISPAVVFFALFTVFMGAFQGGGDTKPIMVLNILRLWVFRVPLAYVLTILLGIGPSGIWIAMVFSNVVTAVIGFVLFRSKRWMEKLDPDMI
jgi:putative MATE family efflux protein